MAWRHTGGVEVQHHHSWPRQQMNASGQLHAPAALLPVPIGYEAGWAPQSVWMLWNWKNLAICWDSNPGRPARRYTDSYPDSWWYIKMMIKRAVFSRLHRPSVSDSEYNVECHQVTFLDLQWRYADGRRVRNFRKVVHSAFDKIFNWMKRLIFITRFMSTVN
jgi:hypothetical protein